MKKLSLVVVGLGFLVGIYAFSNKAVAEEVCEQVSFGSVCYNQRTEPEETEVVEEETPVVPVEEPVAPIEPTQETAPPPNGSCL